jgi:hypothetical protein
VVELVVVCTLELAVVLVLEVLVEEEVPGGRVVVV